MRENRLRQLWSQDKTAVNAWLAIPSAWTAEAVAHAGFDSITLDMQHGLMDYATAVAQLQAISTTNAVPMARAAWNEPSGLMRLLDAGVYGIIAPMINNRAEAEAFVGACNYPPRGYRSYGPIRANVYAGDDYYQRANNTILTFALIETAEAMRNLDEILSTPCLSGVYIGTVDLSISLGLAGLGDLNDSQLSAAIDRILALCRKYNLIAGMHAATPESAKELSQLGFRLVTPITDSAALIQAAKNAYAKTREKLMEAE
jgi:4-hydroxy-2-oxoheptanedioate aldolase